MFEEDAKRFRWLFKNGKSDSLDEICYIICNRVSPEKTLQEARQLIDDAMREEVSLQNEKPKPAPPERKQGDVWQVEEKGRSQGWWGMSSEGASGPWNNKQAAEAASRDMFKTAGQHNARNYAS